MSRVLPALLVVLAGLAGPAAAQSTDEETPAAAPPLPHVSAAIADDAGRAARGRTAVNLAAGRGNLQANLAAISLSSNSGRGLVGLQLRQRPATGDRRVDASASIQGGAFAQSQGLLSVNQAAGSGNAQANLFAIGQHSSPLAASGVAGLRDIAGVDDAALAAVAGEVPINTTDTPPPLREAVIAGDAFRGSQGVVQVNQTAGVGNSSANAIVLLLPGGTP